MALLARRGLVPQFQRPKPRRRSMPPHIMRGNAGRARVRVAIEHVFAAQKPRLVCDPSRTSLRSRRSQGRPGAVAAHRSSTVSRRGPTLTENLQSRSPHNSVLRDAVIGLSPWQADKLSGAIRWKG